MTFQGPRPVVVITHEFFPKRGGIATFTEEIARAGAALGHPIEIWAQQAPGVAEKPWPFRIVRMPLEGTHNFTCRLKLAVRLIRERRRLRHAIVYLPEPGPMLALMMLLPFKAFLPRHIVLTFHGSEILRFHADPVTRALTRRLLRHATRVSTLTHYTRKLLCDRFPEAEDKTFLTPGALREDFAVQPRTPDNRTEARAAGKIVVLTVGRLHPRKGQLAALEALQALPPELSSKVEYWIVGSTSKPRYEQLLRATAFNSGAAAGTSGPIVSFLGDLPDAELARIYDRADIFALTSVDHGHSVEGFGLVYLEASARGLPVVAHRIGGVAEAVADGETGILVTPHRRAELTEAFRKLIEDAALRQRMGAAGRVWAKKTSWTRGAEVLFEPDEALLSQENAQ